LSGSDGDALERLVAHDEIGQLAAHYAVAVDSRDLDALVDLFVTNVHVGEDRSGHGALRREFERSLAQVGVTILDVGTHAIDLVDADRATGVVYCHGEVQIGDEWVRQAILYRDTYARVPELGWRFVRRVHELWYGAIVTPNPLDQAPADWPARAVGRGTVPETWPTWGSFWEQADRG
jgi:hypothetical protein